MNIIDMLDIKLDKRELITLVGAGGKTTTMFALAEELRLFGKKVLVTTTTAIFYPLRNQYDYIIVKESYSKEMFLETGVHVAKIVVFGRAVNPMGKLLGAQAEDIDRIFKDNIFDFILVEGDGSRGKPIKAPAVYEPVVPSMTTKVVGLIGMDAIGKKINSEYVHRPEIFCSITNSSMDDNIDAKIVSKLVFNKNGLYKNAPLGCKKYLIFNKVDKEKDLEVLEIISKKIMSKSEGRHIRDNIDIEKTWGIYTAIPTFDNI